jgi:tRNA U34 5-carboxymethylaminomethyl modifying enzyme MnmG/GidA
LRLTEKGFKIGCVLEDRYKKFKSFKQKNSDAIDFLSSKVKTLNRKNYLKDNIPPLSVHDNLNKKELLDLLKIENFN